MSNVKLSDEQKNLISDMVKPEPVFMPGELTPEPTPNALLDGLISWGNTLDFENLPERAVVTIKIGSLDPEYGHKMQMSVIHQVLEPRREILVKKKITVLFMGMNDDITAISDEEMAVAGWERKEKTLIISPHSR